VDALFMPDKNGLTYSHT